jgi:uncharacterized membrane protein
MPGRNAWLFFAVCLAIALMHLSWAYNQLPERVATHFDASGHPDGWSTREGFLGVYLVLVGAMAAIFGGLTALVPRFPITTISLPNRDFWLAPERRENTIRRLGEYLLVMGGITILFDVGVMHLTVQANRTPEEVRLSGWFWLLFTIYMLFVLVWVGWLYWSFRLPKR